MPTRKELRGAGTEPYRKQYSNSNKLSGSERLPERLQNVRPALDHVCIAARMWKIHPGSSEKARGE